MVIIRCSSLLPEDSFWLFGVLVGRTGRDGRLRGPRVASWVTALRPCRDGPWGLRMRRDARAFAALRGSY